MSLFRTSTILRLRLFLLLYLLNLSAAATFLAKASSSQPSTVSIGTKFNSNQNKLLASANGNLFNLIFSKWTDSGLEYCICGVQYDKKGSNSAIWSFNTEPKPVQGSTCELALANNGELSFSSDPGHVVWTSHTTGLGVQTMTLREDGNLVLTDKDQNVVWQSFTAFNSIFNLPSAMNFTRNNTLYERLTLDRSNGFSIPGDYALVLSPNGHLLMVLVETMYAYYSFNPVSINASLVDHIMVGDAIEYYSLGSSNATATVASNVDQGLNASFPIRSGYVEDGNFLISYWNGSKNVLYYNSSIGHCYLPKACNGSYNLCTKDGCKCPPGFVAHSGKDCKPKDHRYNMEPVYISFPPQFSPQSVASQSECSALCSSNSSCNAALFDASTASCSLFPILYTIPEASGNNGSQVMLLKIPKPKPISKAAIAGAVVGSVSFFILALLLLVLIVKRRRRLARRSADELFLKGIARLPPRFTYKELQEATRDFSKKLGAGGFGSVYEGEVEGVKIAVKKLEQGGGQSTEQFQAEVATIGSVSHANLVRLKGFCILGTQRLLVYEFMARGSLDRWLLTGNPDDDEAPLDWDTRYKVALHTARGLEYLHHRCGPEQIVHCDVKLENILLDDNFNAKVADFGLAKLIDANDKHGFMLTSLKGTRGYLAPEWLHELSITTKSDVYSYGVVLLELITGKRCLGSDKGYLPTWAYHVASSSSSSLWSPSSPPSPSPPPPSSFSYSNTTEAVGPDFGNMLNMKGPNSLGYDIKEVEDIILDEQLGRDSVSVESFRRLFTLALGCVHSDPSARPSMVSVVQILEVDVIDCWEPNWRIKMG